MRRLLAIVAPAATFLAACGGGSPPVSDDAASELHAQVSAVRAAVGGHDAAQAARALDTLRASVARLRRAGDVSGDRAEEILAAATAVQDQLVSITTTTTTTTTTVPPTLPHDEGKGNGKGKGNDKGEG